MSVRSVLRRIVKGPPPPPAQPVQPAVRADAWVEKIPIKSFIDIGAHKGEFIDWTLKRFPDVEIFAFEPLAQFAAGLSESYKANQKIKVFPFAVGENLEAEVDFHVSSYAPSSSLLPMADLHKTEFPHTAGSSRETVRIERLDDVMAGVQFAGELFIKVDTQGYEDRVLKGGLKTIAKARVVLIEVSFKPLYEGQCLFDGIYSEMRKLGFTFSGIRSQILSPTDKSILQAHAWFERQ